MKRKGIILGGLSVVTDAIACARRCGAVCPAQNAKLYKRPASEQVLRTPTPRDDSVVERKKRVASVSQVLRSGFPAKRRR